MGFLTYNLLSVSSLSAQMHKTCINNLHVNQWHIQLIIIKVMLSQCDSMSPEAGVSGRKGGRTERSKEMGKKEGRKEGKRKWEIKKEG